MRLGWLTAPPGYHLTGSSEWTKGIKGANATMALVDILSRIEKHEWPLDEHDSFPGLNFVCTPGTLISGGTYESVVRTSVDTTSPCWQTYACRRRSCQVPNYAQTLVDMRPMPDTNVENIIATVEKIISDVITVRKGPFFLSPIACLRVRVGAGRSVTPRLAAIS